MKQKATNKEKQATERKRVGERWQPCQRSVISHIYLNYSDLFHVLSVQNLLCSSWRHSGGSKGVTWEQVSEERQQRDQQKDENRTRVSCLPGEGRFDCGAEDLVSAGVEEVSAAGF